MATFFFTRAGMGRAAGSASRPAGTAAASYCSTVTWGASLSFHCPCADDIGQETLGTVVMEFLSKDYFAIKFTMT